MIPVYSAQKPFSLVFICLEFTEIADKILTTGDLKTAGTQEGGEGGRGELEKDVIWILAHRLQTDPFNVNCDQFFAGQPNKKRLSVKDYIAIGVAIGITLFIFAVILYFLMRGKKRLKDEDLVTTSRFTVNAQVRRLFLWHLTNNLFFVEMFFASSTLTQDEKKLIKNGYYMYMANSVSSRARWIKSGDVIGPRVATMRTSCLFGFTRCVPQKKHFTWSRNLSLGAYNSQLITS